MTPNTIKTWAYIPGYKGKYRIFSNGEIESITRTVKHSRGGEQILIGR